MDYSANVEIKEKKFGWTPLFAATWNGHLSIVKLLLQHGAKLGPCFFIFFITVTFNTIFFYHHPNWQHHLVNYCEIELRCDWHWGQESIFHCMYEKSFGFGWSFPQTQNWYQRYWHLPYIFTHTHITYSFHWDPFLCGFHTLMHSPVLTQTIVLW